MFSAKTCFAKNYTKLSGFTKNNTKKYIADVHLWSCKNPLSLHFSETKHQED